MTAFRIEGGYDTEDMRGHISIVPPPAPGDVQRLGVSLVGSPLVIEESSGGVEMTFRSFQSALVPEAVREISNRLARLGHTVVWAEQMHTLRYGQYLLRD